MDSFTPLKKNLFKIKSKSKFKIISLLFFLLLSMVAMSFYFQNDIIRFIGRANPAPPRCKSTRGCKCGVSEPGDWGGAAKRRKGAYRNECVCGGEYCVESIDFTGGRDDSEGGGGSNPTATPTPTPTPGPTNTPIPTPTDIIIVQIPTEAPTVIPTDVPTEAPTEIPPTEVPTTKPTDKQGPTATPIHVLCGTKDCDDKTNPCRSGYLCVQAKDGSNYCTSPDFAEACKANPSYNSCCTAPGSATATPTPTKVASIPSAGQPKPFVFLIPIGIIILGLLL